ncbi:MAG: hypothetical protein HDT39_06980 [Lachnospiraceae bacterium]|nr:hypothetical protein [Lachnospiraceae bacterium]
MIIQSLVKDLRHYEEQFKEIGDVRRFSGASKPAQFAAIAPLKLSSANNEKTKKRKEGLQRESQRNRY